MRDPKAHIKLVMHALDSACFRFLFQNAYNLPPYPFGWVVRRVKAKGVRPGKDAITSYSINGGL